MKGDAINLKKEYLIERIDGRLRHELRWLLCAAASWACYIKLEKDFGQKSNDKFPKNLPAFTMYSVFVTARNLYDFFLMTEKRVNEIIKEDPKHKPLTWVYFKDFNASISKHSSVYSSKDKDDLHSEYIHIQGGKPTRGVNLKVYEYAKDILKLWEGFCSKISDQEISYCLRCAEEFALREAIGAMSFFEKVRKEELQKSNASKDPLYDDAKAKLIDEFSSIKLTPEDVKELYMKKY